MSNSNYIIKMDNLNAPADQLTDQLSKSQNKNVYSGTNFRVIAGFPYIRSASPFAITLSQNTLDFGTLYPTTPVSRAMDLSISQGSAHGYSIIASQDHPLKSNSQDIIADTTCDNGACSESEPALWTNTLTFGFGFRCDNLTGTDCSTDFNQTNFYKQFADDSRNESAQTIISSSSIGLKNKSRITYKVNISGAQKTASYYNTITYIAIPNF